MNAWSADVASFVAKLEQAYAEFRISGPLLRRQAPGSLLFEAIALELTQAVFHLPDPVVATGKLQWWREELQRSHAAQARHPLTRELGTPAGPAPDHDLFDGLIAQATQGRDAPPAADFAAQRAALLPAFVRIERLRVSLLGTPDAAVAVQAEVRMLAHLLRGLARLPLAEDDEPLPVSMQSLARHQLSRGALREAGAARDALARTQLADIAAALAALRPAVEADAGWIGRLRWRCERWRTRPLPVGDPFAPLWSRLDRAPWDTAWQAWRGLRRER
jgi:phytoene synthase